MSSSASAANFIICVRGKKLSDVRKDEHGTSFTIELPCDILLEAVRITNNTGDSSSVRFEKKRLADAPFEDLATCAQQSYGPESGHSYSTVAVVRYVRVFCPKYFVSETDTATPMTAADDMSMQSTSSDTKVHQNTVPPAATLPVRGVSVPVTQPAAQQKQRRVSFRFRKPSLIIPSRDEHSIAGSSSGCGSGEHRDITFSFFGYRCDANPAANKSIPLMNFLVRLINDEHKHAIDLIDAQIICGIACCSGRSAVTGAELLRAACDKLIELGKHTKSNVFAFECNVRAAQCQLLVGDMMDEHRYAEEKTTAFRKAVGIYMSALKCMYPDHVSVCVESLAWSNGDIASRLLSLHPYFTHLILYLIEHMSHNPAQSTSTHYRLYHTDHRDNDDDHDDDGGVNHHLHDANYYGDSDWARSSDGLCIPLEFVRIPKLTVPYMRLTALRVLQYNMEYCGCSIGCAYTMTLSTLFRTLPQRPARLAMKWTSGISLQSTDSYHTPKSADGGDYDQIDHALQSRSERQLCQQYNRLLDFSLDLLASFGSGVLQCAFEVILDALMHFFPPSTMMLVLQQGLQQRSTTTTSHGFEDNTIDAQTEALIPVRLQILRMLASALYRLRGDAAPCFASMTRQVVINASSSQQQQPPPLTVEWTRESTSLRMTLSAMVVAWGNENDEIRRMARLSWCVIRDSLASICCYVVNNDDGDDHHRPHLREFVAWAEEIVSQLSSMFSILVVNSPEPEASPDKIYSPGFGSDLRPRAIIDQWKRHRLRTDSVRMRPRPRLRRGSTKLRLQLATPPEAIPPPPQIQRDARPGSPRGGGGNERALSPPPPSLSSEHDTDDAADEHEIELPQLASAMIEVVLDMIQCTCKQLHLNTDCQSDIPGPLSPIAHLLAQLALTQLSSTDRVRFPLFALIWKCLESVVACDRAALPSSVFEATTDGVYGLNRVILPIVTAATLHCDDGAPPRKLLQALCTICDGMVVESDQVMCDAFHKFLRALLPWLPHNVHDESFELAVLVLQKLPVHAMHESTMVLLINVITDRSTIRSTAYQQLRQQVFHVILNGTDTCAQGVEYVQLVMRVCVLEPLATFTDRTHDGWKRWNRPTREANFLRLQEKLVFFVEYLSCIEEALGSWSHGSWCTAMSQYIHMDRSRSSTSAVVIDNDDDDDNDNGGVRAILMAQVHYLLSNESIQRLRYVCDELIHHHDAVMRHVGIGMLETLCSLSCCDDQHACMRESWFHEVMCLLQSLVASSSEQQCTPFDNDGHLQLSIVQFMHTFMFNAIFKSKSDDLSAMRVVRAGWMNTLWPYMTNMVHSSWYNLSVLALQNLCQWTKWIATLDNDDSGDDDYMNAVIESVLKTIIVLVRDAQWEIRFGGLAIYSSLMCARQSSVSKPQRLYRHNTPMHQTIMNALKRICMNEWQTQLRDSAKELYAYVNIIIDDDNNEDDNDDEEFERLCRCVAQLADRVVHAKARGHQRSSRLLKRSSISKASMASSAAQLSLMSKDLYNSSLASFETFHTIVDVSQLVSSLSRDRHMTDGATAAGDGGDGGDDDQNNLITGDGDDDDNDDTTDDDDDDDDESPYGMEFLRFLRSQYRRRAVSTLHRRRSFHPSHQRRMTRRKSAQSEHSKYHFRIQPVPDEQNSERALFKINVDDVFDQAVDVLYQLLKEPSPPPPSLQQPTQPSDAPPSSSPPVDPRLLDIRIDEVTESDNHGVVLSESSTLSMVMVTPPPSHNNNGDDDDREMTYDELGVIDLDDGAHDDDSDGDENGGTEVERVFERIESELSRKKRGGGRPGTASLSGRRRHMRGGFQFPVHTTSSSVAAIINDKHKDDNDDSDDDDSDDDDDDVANDGEIEITVSDDKPTDTKEASPDRKRMSYVFRELRRFHGACANNKRDDDGGGDVGKTVTITNTHSDDDDDDDSDGDWGSDSDSDDAAARRKHRMRRGDSARVLGRPWGDAPINPVSSRYAAVQRTQSLPGKFTSSQVKSLSEKARLFFLRQVSRSVDRGMRRNQTPQWMLQFLRAPSQAFQSTSNNGSNSGVSMNQSRRRSVA